MRVLITNDDGYTAPGLHILSQVMRDLGHDVWVVAPSENWSASSRALSIRHKIYITQKQEQEFTLTASPATCVLVALHEIIKGKKPDLLLSGINRGANLGEDIGCSGTVGCAIEGSLFGIKSIALSQDVIEHPAPWEYVSQEEMFKGCDWSSCMKVTSALLPILIKFDMPRNTCLVINFPNCAPEEIQDIRFVRQGIRAHESHRFVKHRDEENKLYYTFDRRAHVPDSELASEDTDLYCNMHRIISILAASACQDDHETIDQKKMSSLLKDLRMACKF